MFHFSCQKIRHLFLYLCLLWALVIHFTVPVSAEEPLKKDVNAITWHMFEAPPLMILKGKHKGTGIVDGLRNLIQDSLSDFKHDEITLPYKRYLLYAKEKRSICTTYLFKNPQREKFLYFSNPAIIFPGFEIILHKDTYAKLDYPAVISLHDLFEKFNFRLATNKIRSYGPKIDPIIKAYDEKKKVSRHTGSTTLVFRLIAAKRADFMIDFPNRLLYWAHALNVDPNDFLSIPVTEDYRNAISYVACPKTKWGAAVIDRVNAVLSEHIATPAYLDILKRWSPEYHKQEIDGLHKTLIQKNKEAL